MTMIQATENLFEQHCYGGYGCAAFIGNLKDGFGLIMSRLEGYGCLGSNQMAEDESRMESVNEEEAGSSSKDAQQDVDDAGWLQLSIGATGLTNNNNTKDHHQQRQVVIDQDSRRTQSGGGHRLVELDLLSQAGLTSSEQLSLLPQPMFHHVPEIPALRPPPSFWQHPPTFPQHHQEINWGFRPFSQRNIVAASPSSSSLGPLVPPGSYFARPFYQVLQTGLGHAPRPGIDFRVIDPPPRPHSGIWFMLQAAQNQAKEPFLPQISKSFLRTRDGRMTIRLVIKYLVNKLKLENESEVEIRCRGQHILPFLTLQHVRDSIWNPRDALVTLLPSDDSTSAVDHVMVLHYGRSP